MHFHALRNEVPEDALHYLYTNSLGVFACRRITQRVAEKLKELDEAIAKERAESPPDPGDMGDPAMPNIQEAVDMTGGSPDAKVKDDDKPLSSKPPAADSRAFPDASNQRVEVEVAADGQPQP